MNILAVDTTGETLSLALKTGDRVYLSQRKTSAPHDETLLPCVDRLLRKAGLKLAELDAIAAASGPGRFTGIRIGMAYAAVAAGQMKIKALAISRLEAIAFKAPGEKVCAVIEGFRGEGFYQLFRRKKEIPKAFEKPVCVAPENWPQIKASLKAQGNIMASSQVSAIDLLAPAAYCLARKNIPKFEPLYLKPAGYESKHKASPRV